MNLNLTNVKGLLYGHMIALYKMYHNIISLKKHLNITIPKKSAAVKLLLIIGQNEFVWLIVNFMHTPFSFRD